MPRPRRDETKSRHSWRLPTKLSTRVEEELVEPAEAEAVLVEEPLEEVVEAAVEEVVEGVAEEVVEAVAEEVVEAVAKGLVEFVDELKLLKAVKSKEVKGKVMKLSNFQKSVSHRLHLTALSPIVALLNPISSIFLVVLHLPPLMWST